MIIVIEQAIFINRIIVQFLAGKEEAKLFKIVRWCASLSPSNAHLTRAIVNTCSVSYILRAQERG